MHPDAHYPWASGDYLEARPNYAYADCLHDDFPGSWAALRAQTLTFLDTEAAPASDTPAGFNLETTRDEWPIDDLLAALRAGLGSEGLLAANTRGTLDTLVQRFEAGKRLYARYRGPELRGDTAADYRDLSRYVRFGEILLAAWEREASLSDLNALLKLADLLCAHVADIPPAWQSRAAAVLRGEGQALRALATAKEVAWPA
jgi:hypothetical protein